MHLNCPRLLPIALLLIGLTAAAGLTAAESRAGTAASPVVAALRPDTTSAADIELDKVGPGSAYPGEYVRYYLDVRNTGTTTTSVILTDTLDSRMNWFSTETNPAVSCDPPAGGIIGCAMGELPPGPAVVRAVTITVQIAPAAPIGAWVINIGQAISPDDPGGTKVDSVATYILPQATPTPTRTPTATPARPPNDDFADGFVIGDPAYRMDEYTDGATNQPEDPLQECTTGGPRQNYHSVWFRHTPTTTMLLNLSTLGSDYDTVLSVYSGTWPSLIVVACNDNIASVAALQSRLAFTATADVTYHFEVTSRTYRSGNLVFQVSERPPVDVYAPLALANAPTPMASPTPTAPPVPGNAIITYINFLGNPPNEPDEWVAIANGGELPVNIGGWSLSDDVGHTLVLPSYVLAPGQTCRVYTNEYHPEWCGFTYQSSYPIWENTGECGHLTNATGHEVSTYCYPVRAR